MDLNRLREELEIDEGVEYEIYLDHLGYPTFGIGHLIRSDDPEFDWPVGSSVGRYRVREAFDEDVQSVLTDCEKLYGEIKEWANKIGCETTILLKRDSKPYVVVSPRLGAVE